ncbi:MAG: hypothetical protein JO065_15705 [Acidobacteria bacterium]|nr:hypothetical protein [Acidobacteriota bacterium]
MKSSSIGVDGLLTCPASQRTWQRALPDLAEGGYLRYEHRVREAQLKCTSQGWAPDKIISCTFIARSTAALDTQP